MHLRSPRPERMRLAGCFRRQSARGTGQAKAISAALPPHVMRVGVFVNAEEAFVHQALTECMLNILHSMATKRRRNAVVIRDDSQGVSRRARRRWHNWRRIPRRGICWMLM